jgi:hypothetical protein
VCSRFSGTERVEENSRSLRSQTLCHREGTRTDRRINTLRWPSLTVKAADCSISRASVRFRTLDVMRFTARFGHSVTDYGFSYKRSNSNLRKDGGGETIATCSALLVNELARQLPVTDTNIRRFLKTKPIAGTRLKGNRKLLSACQERTRNNVGRNLVSPHAARGTRVPENIRVAIIGAKAIRPEGSAACRIWVRPQRATCYVLDCLRGRISF